MLDYKQFYITDAVLSVFCFVMSALNGAVYMESGEVFNGIVAILALVMAVVVYKESKKNVR